MPITEDKVRAQNMLKIEKGFWFILAILTISLIVISSLFWIYGHPYGVTNQCRK